MRIGIFGAVVGTGSIDDVLSHVITAEEQGFHSYWAPQIFGWDAVTLLAVVGRETERIELGTSVVPTYPRHPAMLAAQALTTQAAAGGRFTLGIGLSHQPVIEGMFGMSFDRPVRHLREYLDILMPLVDGQTVSAQGETLSANVTLDMADPQPVPVLVAALGPQVLRLASARTAGTITWMTGPTTLAGHTAPALHEGASDAGNPDPRLVCGLPVCVTDDVDGARERAGKLFGFYGHLPSYRAMLDREGVEGPVDIALIGDEDEVRARLERLEEAGVTDFAASEFAKPGEEAERTRAVLADLL